MSDDKKDDLKIVPGADGRMPSRRGVIKAIAWGTPAIAVVTLSSNSLAEAASPPVGTTTVRPTTPAPTTTTGTPTTTTETPTTTFMPQTTPAPPTTPAPGTTPA